MYTFNKFGQVPLIPQIARMTKRGGRAQDIWCNIWLHVNKQTQVCWPSVARLAEMSNCSMRTVRRWLRKFEQSGLLRRLKRFVEGRQTSNLLQMTWTGICNALGKPILNKKGQVINSFRADTTDKVNRQLLINREKNKKISTDNRPNKDSWSSLGSLIRA